MSERYVQVDRETAMLLPVDLREWVAENDLVHFVLRAVESSDLSSAVGRTHGGGSRQYPPAMMMGLLIYSYAQGIFSSRQIERATHYHLGMRYLCANEHPDHDTICEFRRANRALVKAVFSQVLELAGAMGLLQVGIICGDGTKILAQAAARRSLSAAALAQLQGQLQEQIEGLLVEAEAADTKAVGEAGFLPGELSNRRRLEEKIREARAWLAAAVEERAAQREADRQAWQANPIGDPPREPVREVRAEDRINLSDPQSRLMPQRHGGLAPSYNAQLAVTGQKQALIVATEVTQQANDRQQTLPLAKAVKAAVPAAECLVLDSGFDHARQIEEAQRTLGVEIYCPPQAVAEAGGKEPQQQQKKHRYEEARQRSREIRRHLRQKADSAEGRRLLQIRKTTVEPAFGWIKSVLGFRRFSLRGLENVKTEWQLVALAFNCRRISPHCGRN